MSATAGGRRRDDVRLALHVGMDVCFIPLRNAYAERCVCVEERRVRWKGASFVWWGKSEGLPQRRRGRTLRSRTAGSQDESRWSAIQRKAKDLTQRTQRKAENTEKDNCKPTATAARFDETEPAATESTPRAGDTFRLAV